MSDYAPAYGDLMDGDNRIKIIHEMQRYAATHRGFNGDFVDSVERHLESYGKISMGQYQSLLKTYNAFQMNNQR